MSSKKIRELNPYITSIGERNRYDEFLNLLLNNIAIVHKDGTKYEYQIETFIKKRLIESGTVGYDKVRKIWAQVNATGRLNEYGNPTYLTFIQQNNIVFRRKASYVNTELGAYRIFALPNYFCLSVLIEEVAKFVANCDCAIQQNIDAIKTPYIIKCSNKELKLSIEHLLQDKQDGKPAIVVNEELGSGLDAIKTDVEYVADKIDELRTKRIDSLLNKLGIMSANINKKERVQVGEVNATVGQCLDYIYLMIDTFNKQMELYGIDAKMLDNTSLSEYKEEGGTTENEEQQDIKE